MENDESLVDYAIKQIDKNGLSMAVYPILVNDIANINKDDIDKKISLLSGIIDKKVSQAKEKLTEVKKEEFKKMGYTEKLELYKTNRELYERLIK